jgi:hypothetical protein
MLLSMFPICQLIFYPHDLTSISVIISTGLITLVDDCIKRHFHSKSKPRRSHSYNVPLTNSKVDVEFVTPRKMVESIFKRRDSGGSYREREVRQSPLRYSEVESY